MKEETGQDLKSERLKRGLTLQNVSERTRISLGVLQNLEEEKYEEIGAPLLVRSFIRGYCSALGIDPEPVLEKHNARILACNQQTKSMQRYQEMSQSFDSRRRTQTFLLFLLGVVAVGSLISGIWFARNKALLPAPKPVPADINPQQELPSDLTQRMPVPAQPEVKKETLIVAGQKTPAVPGVTTGEAGQEKISSAPPEPPGPSVSPGPPGPSASPGPPGPPRPLDAPRSAEIIHKPLPPKTVTVERSPAEILPEDEPSGPAPAGGALKQHLVIEAHQECWVQVQVDNNKPRDVLVKAGEKLNWEAEEKVKIVLGNAGGVRVQWNGKPLKVQFKPGKVARFSLPDPQYVD